MLPPWFSPFVSGALVAASQAVERKRQTESILAALALLLAIYAIARGR